MIFKNADLNQPRIWLRDVVEPVLVDFRDAPLDMWRAYTAMTVIYQYHERLFYSVMETRKSTAKNLEDFRRELATASIAFDVLDDAIYPRRGHTLKYTNILSGAAVMEFLNPRGTVQRAIIVAKLNRQLLPLLDDVMAMYRRCLDKNSL